MEDQAIGWIAAIIIGGIAGWLAEQFMKSQMGLLMNIVLGIVGAAIASWLFSLLGISFGPGWLGYLIAGFIGASSSSSSYGRCGHEDLSAIAAVLALPPIAIDALVHGSGLAIWELRSSSPPNLLF